MICCLSLRESASFAEPKGGIHFQGVIYVRALPWSRRFGPRRNRGLDLLSRGNPVFHRWKPPHLVRTGRWIGRARSHRQAGDGDHRPHVQNCDGRHRLWARRAGGRLRSYRFFDLRRFPREQLRQPRGILPAGFQFRALVKDLDWPFPRDSTAAPPAQSLPVGPCPSAALHRLFAQPGDNGRC